MGSTRYFSANISGYPLFSRDGYVGKAVICKQADMSPILAVNYKRADDINCPDSARRVITKLAESNFSKDFYKDPEPLGSPISDCFWVAIQAGTIYIATTNEALHSLNLYLSAIKLIAAGAKVEVIITQPPRVSKFLC